MYKLLCLKWITNKDLLYSTGKSAQCYIAAWMGDEFGWEWTHVYTWLSPFAVHLCVCVYLCLCVHTYSFAQWCPTLCTSTNHSPPCSSVHGTSQARILEWVAISYFNGSSRPRDWTCVSCIASRFVTTEPVGESAVHLKLSQYCSSAITQYKIRSLEKIKDQVGLRSLAYRLAHNRYSTKHNC